MEKKHLQHLQNTFFWRCDALFVASKHLQKHLQQAQKHLHELKNPCNKNGIDSIRKKYGLF